MRVYHIPLSSSRVIAWSYTDRYGPGDVLVDPPEHVVERYGDYFDRLDDGEGGVPEGILTKMPRSEVRRIGAAADGVTGNDPTDAIIDAVGSDQPPVDETAAAIDTSSETTAQALDGRDRSGDEPTGEEVADEMRDILDDHPELAEDSQP